MIVDIDHRFMKIQNLKVEHRRQHIKLRVNLHLKGLPAYYCCRQNTHKNDRYTKGNN
jgi:hypothetical protein